MLLTHPDIVEEIPRVARDAVDSNTTLIIDDIE
jgi:hypothetical protein